MTASIESEFAGKRALVTGGTRGIGEAIVERLRGAGAKVITTSRSAPHGLHQPELFVEADLSTAEGVEKVVSGVRERLAGVDILIHNVGGSSAPGGGFAFLTDDEWQHALNSNLLSAVRLDRGLLPWMLKQGAGVIIHISSIQRTLPLYDSTLAYAAAKAALTNYSKGLSKEVGPKGIRVNTVAPGYTETQAAQGMVNEIAQRTGSSREVARQRIMDCTRRNSARQAEPPRGSGRTGRIPRLGPSICHQRKRVCHRRGHDSDDLTVRAAMIRRCRRAGSTIDTRCFMRPRSRGLDARECVHRGIDASRSRRRARVKALTPGFYQPCLHAPSELADPAVRSKG